jgi:hypothetical protein
MRQLTNRHNKGVNEVFNVRASQGQISVDPKKKQAALLDRTLTLDGARNSSVYNGVTLPQHSSMIVGQADLSFERR